MIRINLLAKKVSKKKAGAIQHLAIGAVAVLVLLFGLGWVWANQNGKLSSLRSQIGQQQAEKERLKNVNEDKVRFEKEKAEHERKLAIITKLQKERIMPVRLLDDLTRAIDVTTPIWLNSYGYTGDGVTLEGYSLSHEALRPLVDALERSAYYRDVELLYSERSELQGRMVFHFSIKAGVEQPD